MIGLSGPILLRVGDTRTFADTLPDPLIVLKLKKSYSLVNALDKFLVLQKLIVTHMLGPEPAVKLLKSFPERGHGVTPDTVLP